MKRVFILIATIAFLFSGAKGLSGDDQTPGPNAALQYWPGMADFALAYHRSMTEEQRKPFYDAVHTPLDEKTIELIEQLEDGSHMDFIHRGVMIRRCDWELDFSEGPNTLLLHIDHMRPLTNLMCLSARYRFSIDDHGLAFEHLGNMLTIAHHLATDGKTVPGLGIGLRIEGQALEIAARHLPQAEHEALRKFATRIENLPDWGTMSDVYVGEKAWQLEWLRRTTREEGLESMRQALQFMIENRDSKIDEAIKQATNQGEEHFLRLVDETAPLYDEAIEILRLPITQVDEADAAFARKTQNANIVVQACLGIGDYRRLSSLRYREAEAEARRAMLKAAIAVVLNGRDAVANHQDPFGEGPFEYQERADGFALSSQLKIDGKPFTMTFGAAEK